MKSGQLENLLEGINGAGKDGVIDSEPRNTDELLGQLQSLSTAVRTAYEGQEIHYSLDELRSLIEQRQEQADTWGMPEHLASCPLCLDIFAVILDGIPRVPANTVARYEKIFSSHDEAHRKARVIHLYWGWQPLLKAAAVIAVVLGVTFFSLHSRVPVRIEQGILVTRSGKKLSAKATPRQGTVLTAETASSAVLEDGTVLKADAGTPLSLHKSLNGSITVNLTSGSILVSVAKQEKGKQFTVRTPLFDILVLGTSFRVTCESEPVLVFKSSDSNQVQSSSDTVTAVTVTVIEGVVLVHSRHEELRVHAGQRASLRENELHIDVEEVTK